MNYIRATVTDVQSVECINIVHFKADSQNIQMLSLELNKRVHTGVEVILAVKSTDISLSKETNNFLSISNQLKVKLKSINYGELLCCVKCEFSDALIESVITKEAALKMKLQEDEEISYLIQADKISISEIL